LSSTGVCGATYGEQNETRVNSRNGYRAREWDTRAARWTHLLHLRSARCVLHVRGDEVSGLVAFGRADAREEGAGLP
jgi:hypothetical protein